VPRDRATLLEGWVGRTVCGFGASTVTGGNAWPDCATTGPICMLKPNTLTQKKLFDTAPHADGPTQLRNILSLTPLTVPIHERTDLISGRLCACAKNL
jgi:hypothetical protein